VIRGLKVGSTIKLGRVRKAERAGAAAGLFRAAEHVLGVSNDLVPHDVGDLERSGATDVDAERLIAVIAYDTPYAVVQHEDLTLQHDEGRQAKYLETAVNTERKRVLELVAEGIEEAMRS